MRLERHVRVVELVERLVAGAICHEHRSSSDHPRTVAVAGARRSTASVDVFDTVLTRAVGEPTSVFLVVGRVQAARSVTNLRPEIYAQARVQAERRARATHREWTSIDRIIAEMAFVYDLTSEQRMLLRTIELDVERAVSRPVPGAAESLATIRARFGRVVFVSDTYLPTGFVRDLLVAHGVWQEGDRLFVSCDIGQEKRTGRLFSFVAKAEHTRPWRLVHHGNDPIADVLRARLRGVRAVPDMRANLNRFERILEREHLRSGGLTSSFAGASRLARLTVKSGDEHTEAIRDVSAGVVAPLLTGFVLWLLQHARRTGLKRLYFVSRDGEILLDLASRLAPKVGYDGDLRYLHGSRQAWSLPSTERFDSFTENWLMRDTDFLSVRSVLARADIAPCDVEHELASGGFAPSSWDDNLTGRERKRLIRLIRQGPIASSIVQRAAEKRPILIEYLRQEGFFDGTRAGVVDLGWVGSVGAALVRVLGTAGAVPPERFYYLGLVQAAPAEMSAPQSSFLFDRGRGLGFTSHIPGRMQLLETFCAGTHGLVLGYRRHGERIAPEFKSERNEGARCWGLSTVRDTVATFADALVVDRSLIDIDGDARTGLENALRSFASRPSAGQARAWGAFPFSTDQTESFVRPLATGYRPWEATLTAATGAEHGASTQRYWPGGSVALSNGISRWIMITITPFTVRLRRKAVRRAVAAGLLTPRS